MRSLLIATLALTVLSCGKSKKDVPCFQEAGVTNCSELFDEIQKNATDQQKSLELQDCYDKHCR